LSRRRRPDAGERGNMKSANVIGNRDGAILAGALPATAARC